MSGPYKEKEIQRHTEGRRPCDNTGRDWSDVATNRTTPRITINDGKLGDRYGQDYLRIPRRNQFYKHLDFRLLDSRAVRK